MTVTINLIMQNGSVYAVYHGGNVDEAFSHAYESNAALISRSCDLFPEDPHWMEDAVRCWWEFNGQRIVVLEAGRHGLSPKPEHTTPTPPSNFVIGVNWDDRVAYLYDSAEEATEDMGRFKHSVFEYVWKSDGRGWVLK